MIRSTGCDAISAVIIDDEGPARRELKRLLEEVDPAGVEVVGEAATGAAGLDLILREKPELIFLDIHMPGLTGLELSRLLGSMPEAVARPVIVFVTAHDEYALEAFDADAGDYLLKPVTAERLSRALDKARRRLAAGRPKTVPAATPDPLWRLPLYDAERIAPTPPKRIVFLASDEKKVRAVTTTGEYEAKGALAELEDKLAAHGFFRAHRGHLVNLEHVLEIHPEPGGAVILVMNDPARTRIAVSRSQARLLRERFDF